MVLKACVEATRKRHSPNKCADTFLRSQMVLRIDRTQDQSPIMDPKWLFELIEHKTRV